MRRGTQQPELNVLSLFSGIGGLELGLERAGMACVAQVELDPFCRRVLTKHWPEVPKHDDVRTAAAWWESEPRPAVHVVCGGFPCQPFSSQGYRRGVADERWGWPWFADVVRAVRPRFVVVENVAALLRDADAFGWLLGDLAALGFDAEWSVLSACAVGAPHPRERLFVVAHTSSGMGQARHFSEHGTSLRQSDALADAARHWAASPTGTDRVAHGLAGRMVTAGGNAVVPQVAEYIGRMIVAADLAVVAS